MWGWGLGALALCLSACTPPSHMKVESFAGDCAKRVRAYHVDASDEPDPLMNKEAMRLCPMGYDRFATNKLGDEIVWLIECHGATEQTAQCRKDLQSSSSGMRNLFNPSKE
jgi:hypothetical protein